MASQWVQWRLKSGADRRFRAGHPWVYSNELSESPKGIEPGAQIELRDAGGKFLARGYGNPHSLIAFRALSRDPENDPFSEESLSRTLHSARQLREQMGLGKVSFRLCFGEADGIPGLVIDRYALASGKKQVFAIQAHSAGIQRVLDRVVSVLKKLQPDLATGIVIRNDLGVRKLEGIEVEEPRVLEALSGEDLTQAKILVAGTRATSNDADAVEFQVDLARGQKTGFFLDQVGNIQLAARRLGGLRPKQGPLKILDLCCYVGQWGAQLARHFRAQGLDVEVTAVDASASALEFARHNVQAQGARFEAVRGDVLKDLEKLPARSFDLVICDPPALIKSRKDIPAGKHAYLQLNTQALRLTRPEGGIVSCSCSALLEEEDLLAALAKASARNSVQVRWIGRGSPAPDHPMLAEFPEGRYLKCWIGMLQ